MEVDDEDPNKENIIDNTNTKIKKRKTMLNSAKKIGIKNIKLAAKLD